MRTHKTTPPAQAGQGIVEYILMIVFVALAGIVVWRGFSTEIKKIISETKDAFCSTNGEVIKTYKDDG